MALRRTALYDEHVRAGGRLIDFGGWELPVQYTGVMDEHLACRKACGLFDVSHMGEVHVEGPDAEAFLNWALTNNVAKVAVNQAQYTLLCHPSGGIVDDLVIYRRASDRFLVVVNASNTEKDFACFQDRLREYQATHPGSRISLTNESARYTQIALQGRLAQQILAPLTDVALDGMKTYWFGEGHVLGKIPAIVARTGYTGEDGFEIYVPWERGPDVWRALMESGTPLGLKPCGLGARDTLRLEMKYPLYGNELGDTTNALEAGLGWVVKMDKGEFVGRPAFAATKEAGLKRKLVGFKMAERGIPRHGYKAFDASGSQEWGEVTSGTQSPSLGAAIGIAYVPAEHAAIGQTLTIDVRGQKLKAQIIETPFYKRA